jgi:adenosylcobyric acid synthase
MLGHRIDDPGGIEGPAGFSDGLGLLDVETAMTPQKSLTKRTARHPASGTDLTGYEIHIGVTTGPDRNRPLFSVEDAPEGAGQGDYADGVDSTLDSLAAHLEAHLDLDAMLSLAHESG